MYAKREALQGDENNDSLLHHRLGAGEHSTGMAKAREDLSTLLVFKSLHGTYPNYPKYYNFLSLIFLQLLHLLEEIKAVKNIFYHSRFH